MNFKSIILKMYKKLGPLQQAISSGMSQAAIWKIFLKLI